MICQVLLEDHDAHEVNCFEYRCFKKINEFIFAHKYNHIHYTLMTYHNGAYNSLVRHTSINTG